MPAKKSGSGGRHLDSYKKQSYEFLKYSFRRVSAQAICCVLEDKDYHFTASYETLKAVKRIIEDPNRDDSVILKEEKIVEQVGILAPVRCIVLKSSRPCKNHPRTSNRALKEEMSRIPDLRQKDKRPETMVVDLTSLDAEEDEALEQRTTGKENATATANTTTDSTQAKVSDKKVIAEYTCGCCFLDFPFEEMCQCTDGHLFCSKCVDGYVAGQVFEQRKTQFMCMELGGCCGEFISSQLERAIPPDRFKQIQEHLQRNNVNDAGLRLCTCPKCPFQFCQESTGNMFISCRECKHKFCRECQEGWHKGKTCDQAAQEKTQKSVIHKTEDAMTEALIRKCPNCAMPFFKEEGCNKMVCPSCKTKSCYLCRQQIKGYDHFCQTALCTHESCGKCTLFTNTVEDDRRARREAGEKMKENAGDDTAEKISSLMDAVRSPPEKNRRPLAAIQNNRAGDPVLAHPNPRPQQRPAAAAPPAVPAPRHQHRPVASPRALEDRQPQIGAINDDNDQLPLDLPRGVCIVS